MGVAPTTRLAMVACFGPHEGPWLRGRGNETGIRVICLGDGEVVDVEREQANGLITTESITSDGEVSVGAFKRIRFVKRCSGKGSKPTTVELLIS